MQVLQSNGLKRVPRTGQVRGTEGTGLHCIPPQQSFIFWETVVDILQLCCSNLCCSNLWWTAFKCYCWPSTTAEMLEPDSRGSVGLVSLIWSANPIPGSLISGASGCSPQSGKCQVNSIHPYNQTPVRKAVKHIVRQGQ